MNTTTTTHTEGNTVMNTTDRQVAVTIVRQIGTDTLLAVSARDYVFTYNSASFAYGTKGGAWHRINVTLQADDTYTIEATRTPSRGRNFGYSTVTARYKGVYADQLSYLIRDINNDR